MSYIPGSHTASNKPYATQGGPDSARYLYYDEFLLIYRPYKSVQEVLDYLNTDLSREGRVTVLVETGGMLKEYWFLNGVADSDLIEKTVDVDLSNYIQQGDNVSLLNNDANYITLANLPELADVAYSGNYNDLINTPTIPDLTGYATEQWVLDRNYLTGVTWGIITGDQSVIGNAGFNNTANFITADDLPELADVAYSGDYNDLINLPTIPDLTGYATEQWVIDQNYLKTIPSNYLKTGDNISGLVNDSGYLLPSDISNVIRSGDNISELNNDAGYITSSSLPSPQTLSWASNSGMLSISGGNSVSVDGRYSFAPIIDNTLGFETSASLNIAYPSAKAGFTVISKTAGIKYSKIDPTDWEQIGVVIV